MFQVLGGDLSIEELIALVVVIAFVGVSIANGKLDTLEKLAYIVTVFYFNNKANKNVPKV